MFRQFAMIAAGFCLLTTGALAEEMVVGGYSPASTKSADVAAAAAFAVKTHNADAGKAVVRLASVKTAETQVVAGQNFRLCLVVKQKGKRHRVQAVVYRDLQQAMHLSQWTDGGC